MTFTSLMCMKNVQTLLCNKMSQDQRTHFCGSINKNSKLTNFFFLNFDICTLRKQIFLPKQNEDAFIYSFLALLVICLQWSCWVRSHFNKEIQQTELSEFISYYFPTNVSMNSSSLVTLTSGDERERLMWMMLIIKVITHSPL